MTVTATVHTPEEIAITALTDEERAYMARLALQGWRFRYWRTLSDVGVHRWKAEHSERVAVCEGPTLFSLLGYMERLLDTGGVA